MTESNNMTDGQTKTIDKETLTPEEKKTINQFLQHDQKYLNNLIGRRSGGHPITRLCRELTKDNALKITTIIEKDEDSEITFKMEKMKTKIRKILGLENDEFLK